MRLLFLNQYFPPDSAPTGVHLSELAEFLRKNGHEIEYISANQQYSVRKTGAQRFVRELHALSTILRRGLAAQRPDIVVCGSSPPCLLLAAVVIAARHRARCAHWLLDMYPELAIALGELQQGRAVKIIQRLMEWGYKRAEVVALDADMAERLKAVYKINPHVVTPWVPDALLADGDQVESPRNVWLYSGNLGRAHEWATLLEAQAEVERRNLPIRLVFQGDGPSWSKAQQRAAELGLQKCEWSGYVSQDQLKSSLLRARVTVATQRPETCGLLWPSKVGVLMQLPRPFLWVGPTGSAIAQLIKKNPRNGIFAPGDATGVAGWLEREFHFPELPQRPAGPDEKKQNLLHKWLDIIENRL